MKITHINHIKGDRPNIEIKVCRVETSEWDRFKKHHYMTEEINKGCKSLLFSWNSQPIAFCALLNKPFRGGHKNNHIISRLVILPDFQGFGFTRDILHFVGGLITALGGNLYIKTVHRKMGRFLQNSDEWEPTANNGKYRKGVYDKRAKNRLERTSYCYKYVGSPIYGYEYLLTSIKELRKNKSSYLHRLED